MAKPYPGIGARRNPFLFHLKGRLRLMLIRNLRKLSVWRTRIGSTGAVRSELRRKIGFAPRRNSSRIRTKIHDSETQSESSAQRRTSGVSRFGIRHQEGRGSARGSSREECSSRRCFIEFAGR